MNPMPMRPMTALHQTISHDPDNGKWGDCYRTAIACILGWDDPETVPHFYHGNTDENTDDQHTAKYRWLAEIGLISVRLGYPAAEWTLGQLLDNFRHLDHPYLIGGSTEDGIGHVVIAERNRIVWDPNPAPIGLTGPHQESQQWVIELIFRRTSTYTLKRNIVD